MSDYGPVPTEDEEDENKPVGGYKYGTYRGPSSAELGEEGLEAERGNEYRRAQGTPATFYNSDIDKPKDWSPNRLYALQSAMVAGGLLSERGFSLGVWDPPTRNAYKSLLGFANNNGYTRMEDALDVFLRSPRGGMGGGRRRDPLVVELPNPDDLRKVIDKTVPEVLGRALSAEEREALIGTYNSLLTEAQRKAYGVAESGGTVTEAPSIQTFAAQRAKELHPEEADTFQKFNLVGDVMGLLGINPEPAGPLRG